LKGALRCTVVVPCAVPNSDDIRRKRLARAAAQRPPASNGKRFRARYEAARPGAAKRADAVAASTSTM
jgi:hypothetical protein